MFTSSTCTIKGFINSQSNLISMQSTATSSIEILTISTAMNKIQGTSNPREPTTASPISRNVSCVKEFVCQNGGKVRIEWNPRTGINVCLSSSEGPSISIRPENLPREFHHIKCSRGFYQFMKGLSVRLIELDNGELKITAFHPLRGGTIENHSHLEGAKDAFEMIALRYKKTLPSPDYNIKKFTKWLKNSDIFCGEPAGTDRQGLIHAVLQHATGRYDGKPFSETSELSQEISTISASSSESSDDITLRHTLDFIKNRDGLDICVILIQANQKGQPVKISQVGNETAHPVVIWKRGDEYLALTTTDYHKPTEEGLPSPNEEEAFSPDPDLPPNASTSVDLSSTEEKINPIEEAIGQLRTHLRDLKNPFVRQSIEDALLKIGLFRPSEGIANFFEGIILPQDSQQCIHALNKAITEQMREFYRDRDLLQELIRKLKALGKEHVPKEESWKDLDMLLKLDEVKSLPNKIVEIVMNFIAKGDLHLIDYLPEELKRVGVNLIELDRKLGEQEDRMSLNSLIRLIILRKPTPTTPFIWHQSARDSLIGKILSLTDPKTKENFTGVISDCQQLNEAWTFTLMDDSKVKIHLSSKKITLSKFRDIELCNALTEGVIDRISQTHSNEIELICSDTKRTLINPGKYTISNYHPLKKHRRNRFFKDKKIQNSELKMALDGSKNQGNYIICMIFSGNSQQLKDLVEVRIVDLKRPSSGQVLTSYQFRDSYFIRVPDKITFSGIDILNNDKHLQFQEEVPNNMKLYYLKIVKKKEILLRTELLNDHHVKILEYLLDNLVSNHLKKINSIEKLAIPDDFKRLLNEIVQIYHEKLDRPDASAKNILMQIVIDTNYACLVDRDQSILVGKTIQLIHEAYAQISKIRDNDVILFMGNTGAGKSTGINFFLNAPLEKFQNEIGDKAIKIRDGITDPKKYPKIGQSLGISETLYGQGYEVPQLEAQGRIKLLVDCPGFNDTRGSDYELCAALSLDQIVNACHSITCIVLVVPIQAFLFDKANPVINLVDSMREIFSGAFLANTSGKALPIHILITKHSLEQEINFKHRISTLLLEAEDELRKSLNNQEASEAEIIAHQHRVEIWKFIAEMVKVNEERVAAGLSENIRLQNTLSFLNITDTFQSRGLLDWYARSKTPSQTNQIKRNYVPRMQSSELKEKLGRYIQSFVHTWCEGVVQQYLEIVPTRIGESERQIETCHSHQNSLIQHKRKIETNQEKLESEKISIEKLIEELESTTGAADEIDKIKPKLFSKLEKRVRDANRRTLSIVQQEIQSIHRSIEENKRHIQKEQCNLEILNRQLKVIQESIIEKINEIQRLSEGERETFCTEFSRQPEDVLAINTVERPRMLFFSTVFKTIDDPNADKGERSSRTERVQASQFNGHLKHRVRIPIEYSLKLNRNIVILEKLWKRIERRLFQSASDIVGSGPRLAKVTGNQVSLNLSETIENEHYTEYYFETKWTGSNCLPSFKISDLQLNIEYNAAIIANKIAEINNLNNNRRERENTFLDKQIEINTISRYINQEIMRLKVLEEEELSLKRELNTTLIEWKKEKEQELQILKNSQARYNERLESIENSLRKAKDDLGNYQRELCQLKRKKRDLAIIIQTQTEVASTIRTFIEEILNDNRNEFAEIRALNGMVSDCTKFIASFDTHWEKLHTDCQEDLSSSHLKDLTPPSSPSSCAPNSSSSSSISFSSVDWIPPYDNPSNDPMENFSPPPIPSSRIPSSSSYAASSSSSSSSSGDRVSTAAPQQSLI